MSEPPGQEQEGRRNQSAESQQKLEQNEQPDCKGAGFGCFSSFLSSLLYSSCFPPFDKIDRYGHTDTASKGAIYEYQGIFGWAYPYSTQSRWQTMPGCTPHGDDQAMMKKWISRFLIKLDCDACKDHPASCDQLVSVKMTVFNGLPILLSQTPKASVKRKMTLGVINFDATSIRGSFDESGCAIHFQRPG